MAWLRLIRWQNLLIIILTQFMVWWCIILPEHPTVLSLYRALLLITSTTLIAAAGYIINDYFDIRIDQINHPDKVVLGNSIPRKTAIIAHTILNIAALLIAGFVALSANHIEWLAIQLACTGLLWVYSTRYKRRYITGNIVVAVLTALTIIVMYIYEPAMHRAATLEMLTSGTTGKSSLPAWMIAGYAYFAFVFTWIREIVKDMEDLKGDEADGCVTMPVVKGLAYASRFATALAIAAATPLLIAIAVLFRYHHFLLALYILVLLVAPTLYWIKYLWRGVADATHYHKASRFLKIIMIMGICTLLIYKYR